MKEYKVMSQKDKWHSGKFDPAKLEKALNIYAKEGWRVIAVTTAKVPAMLNSGREEFLAVLERDV